MTFYENIEATVPFQGNQKEMAFGPDHDVFRQPEKASKRKIRESFPRKLQVGKLL